MLRLSLLLCLLLAGCGSGAQSGKSQDDAALAREAKALQSTTDQSVKAEVNEINTEAAQHAAAASVNETQPQRPAGAGAAQTK
jgi:hypothetical protein